jgi:hypothetical protein
LSVSLNDKASKTHTHLLGEVTDVTATSTELNILDYSAQIPQSGQVLRSNGAGIAWGAVSYSEVMGTPTLPNSFETISVNNTGSFTWAAGVVSVVADNTSDTLNLVAGSGITLESDATNDAIRISGVHPTISAGSNISQNGSNGVVVQDLTVTLDGNGHVTATNISTVDLDGRYDQIGHTHTISEVTDVTSTAAELNLVDYSAQSPTSGHVLRSTGAGIAWGQIDYSDIANTPAQGNLFQTISVNDNGSFSWTAGMGNVVADSTSDTLNLVGGPNITLEYDATNDGVRITGTHDNISAGSNISQNNSNGTVIQDLTITLDSNGHVTTATSGSTDLDLRYSQLGHTHTASQITNYTTVLAGTANTTAFTPSADYHPATKKYVDDTVTAAGGYTDEDAQDAVGTILTDTATIDFTYDDAGNQITAAVKDAGVSGLGYIKGVEVEKNGTSVGTRPIINFIEGSNITLTVADDAANGEIDVTIDSSAGGSTLAALSDTDVTTPASGNILVYDGTNSWDNVAMSGHATISNTGVLSLSSTGVSANTYGSATAVGQFTVDAQGRITSASTLTINHGNLTGFVANEHIDHTSVSITAGDGLSGGGTIASTRTIDFEPNSLTIAAINTAADYLVFADASDSGNPKRVLADDLLSGHTHVWGDITGTPTTISGYGITDAYTQTNLQTSGQSSVHWGNLTSVPSTFAPSAHTHTISEISDVNATAAEVNILDYSAQMPSSGEVLRSNGSGMVWGPVQWGDIFNAPTGVFTIVNVDAVDSGYTWLTGYNQITASGASDSFSIVKGSGIILESDATNDGIRISLDDSGDWTGTFDGQEGSYYLNYNNLSNTPTVPTASDVAYGVSWNGNLDVPTKNAIYDKIESLPGGHAAVTLNTTSHDYLSLSTQEIILGAIDLAADVTGELPMGSVGGGTGLRVVTTDVSGNLETYNNVTTTELEYLNGVTSGIQGQIDDKIGLTDLSVGVSTPASGSGAITYDNSTGEFTFTPPDLSSYLTDAPSDGSTYGRNNGSWVVVGGGSSTLDGLSDTTITGPASNDVLQWSGTAWVDRTLAEAGIAAASHTHAASDVTSGTFADARISSSSVTQHIDKTYVDSLNVDADTLDGQDGAYYLAYGNLTGAPSIPDRLTDLVDVTNSLPSSRNVLVANGSVWASRALEAADIQSGTFANARISQSSVTQHEAALSITESQISDLSHFSPSTLLADYGFTDNSTNWNTAFGWGDHSTEGYLTTLALNGLSDVSTVGATTSKFLTSNVSGTSFSFDTPAALGVLYDGLGQPYTSADTSIDAALKTVEGVVEDLDTVEIAISAASPDQVLTVKDGYQYIVVPEKANGKKLNDIRLLNNSAGTGSSVSSFRVYNVTQATSLLTTNVSIDSTETDSDNAATPFVVDSGVTLATGDILRVDCTGLTSGADAEGLYGIIKIA